LQRLAVGLFFVIFAGTQLLIALPANYGLAGLLAPLTRIYEKLGLKHRWSLFTHAAHEEHHSWRQIRHIVKVTDASGQSHEWIWPQTSGGWLTRYLHHREADYLKIFWSTKRRYGKAFARDHARMFVAETGDPSFPLHIEVFQDISVIRHPFDFEPPVASHRSLLHQVSLSETERFCSERDKL